MSNKDTITLPREVVERVETLMKIANKWSDDVDILVSTIVDLRDDLTDLRTALATEQPKPEALEVAYEFETHVLFGSGSTISRTLLEKAVTTLRSQHAENEALRRDAERLREELEEDAGVIAVWRGRTERAEAENERLREVEQRANELLKTLDAKFPMPVRHQDVNTQMFNLRAVLKLMEDKR